MSRHGSGIHRVRAKLLTTEPLDVVVAQHERVEKAAAGLGSLPPALFAVLSFLALPVIPQLRLTDLGVVDVVEFKLIKWNKADDLLIPVF